MSAAAIADRGFHLFVYGTLRGDGAAAHRMADCTYVGPGVVRGTLYDIDGDYPALMLYGDTPVSGEIWHVPSAAALAGLDEYEGVGRGLFRRVAVSVNGHACWVYVAGHRLGRRLTADRRI
jgi:gamma-glutamylcyclotransferase (GGCT)/AIG2-like uncharacterized protein YtfP